MKVLQIQKNALAERAEALEINERAQEDRWQWLEQYHSWLRSLPFESTAAGDTGPEGDQTASVTLRDRLSMMETSVVMQSQELKRTKELFLRHGSKLQDKLDELGRRHTALLRMKCSSGSLNSLGTGNGARTPSRLPRRMEPQDVARVESDAEDWVPGPGHGDVAGEAPTRLLSQQAAHEISTSTTPGDHGREMATPPAFTADSKRPAPLAHTAGPTGLIVQPIPTNSQALERWTHSIGHESHNQDNSAPSKNVLSESPPAAGTGPRDDSLLTHHPRISDTAAHASSCDAATNVPSAESEQGQKKKKKKKKPKFEWSEHQDPSTKLPYYHNRLTKETTWTKPGDFPGRPV